jgi:ClpP class serine protease
MRVLSAITSTPWLMPKRYLRALYSIASRDLESVPEDIRARYEERLRGEGPHAVITRMGERLAGTQSVAFRDGVAVVPIIGPIFRYADFFTDISGALTLDDLARDFASAISNTKVRDVVLYIDSPGGEANGIHEFAQNIVRIAADTSGKRVIAYIAGVGASAAYWIASACNEIVVDRTAMAPCIGVVFTLQDPADEKGYIEIVSTQSPKKRLDVTTDDGRQEIQKWADDLAAIFISCVASNRELAEDVVMSAGWGEGSLEIGQALVAAGVADRLGSFEELVNELIGSRSGGAQTSSFQHKPSEKKENGMGRKPRTQLAAKADEETPDKGAQSAAAGGECDCCSNDTEPCGCPSKDQSADGVCSCKAGCPNCVENDCDGEIETPAASATDTSVASAAATPRVAARKASSSDEVVGLRAKVAQLERINIEASANALIDSAVRDLKMPPLPVVKEGQARTDTLSSLLRDTLVDSQVNTACPTCQANHDRAAKVIALLPPAVPTGRMNIKPVRETASIVSGSSATVEQADLHIAVSQQLASKGLKPGSKKYQKAYRELHTELSAAAASSVSA